MTKKDVKKQLTINKLKQKNIELSKRYDEIQSQKRNLEVKIAALSTLIRGTEIFAGAIGLLYKISIIFIVIVCIGICSITLSVFGVSFIPIDSITWKITLQALVFLVILGLVVGGYSNWLLSQNRESWWGNWFQGISTEMTGAIITGILFTVIVGVVQESESNKFAEQAEIQQQIQLMSSSDNRVALEASERLYFLGARSDGTLVGVDLAFATLQRANLSSTNFMGANLRAVNFDGADLSRTDLRSADLAYANLRNTTITPNTQFDETTILPDCSRWSEQIDIGRFIDQSNPDFINITLPRNENIRFQSQSYTDRFGYNGDLTSEEREQC